MNSARYAGGPSRSRNEAVGLFAFKLGCVCALNLAMICTVARAGSLAYMTQNRSLKELELSMSNYYLALDRKDALPVQRVKDDIGATVQDLMYAAGLIRGRSDSAAFPNDLYPVALQTQSKDVLAQARRLATLGEQKRGCDLPAGGRVAECADSGADKADTICGSNGCS